MVHSKKKVVGCGLAAAGFFIAALLVAGAAMGGDGGLADDRIADMGEGGSSGVIAASPVSSSINYQGRLTDSSGNPLDLGKISMTFKLYDNASSNTALATDTHQVTVTNGLFSTEIAFDSSYFDGRALWLGITIGEWGLEMTPRQALQPVPYALSLLGGANIIYGGVVALHAESTHPSGRGLRGYATATSGTNYGVVGASKSPDGYGGYFYNNGGGIGVYGEGEEAGGYFTTTTAGASLHEKPGVNVSTRYSHNPGVMIYTSGGASGGVYAFTEGDHSDGVSVVTDGDKSRGVWVDTDGDESEGVWVDTDGDKSRGVWVDTEGDYSYGVVAATHGNYTDGVRVYTFGDYSDGVAVETHGYKSEGVYAETYGNVSPAVYGYSDKYFGGIFNGAEDMGVLVYGDIDVQGDIYKWGSCQFVEDHPKDPTKEIVYVCLEGGETGTYTRGSAQLTDGAAVVQLPEHFSLVTIAEGLTVQVTPTSDCKGLYVVSKSPSELVVKELNGGTSAATFDYLVNGIRHNYEEFQPIRDKQERPDLGDEEHRLSAEHEEHRD